MAVSVVIPVYNIEGCLRECLDSVAAQSLGDIEVLCVDDGSTDASPAILAEYAARDSRFQVIAQANAGPGAARNAGLARARGEYVIFLDSDDRFEPSLLETLVKTAEETGADITLCRSDEFDHATGKVRDGCWMRKDRFLPGKVFSPGDIADHLFQFTYGWPWDKLYRMDFLERTGLSYPPLPNSEDLVFVFPSLALAERMAVTDDVLVHHRMGRGASVSNSRHRDPEVPHRALELFARRLREDGLYETFERSFLNWAMEFLVWNAANLDDKAARRAYLRKLKKQWLPEMDFSAHPRSYYEDKFTYRKYLLARYAPGWAFDGVVRGYKALKRGMGRG